MDWELYDRYRATLVLIGLALVASLLLAFQRTSLVRRLRAFLAISALPSERFLSQSVPSAQSDNSAASASSNTSTQEPLARWALSEGLAQEQLRLFHTLKEENERLQQLLNLKEQSLPDAIAARVIERDPQRWFQQILLDKGSEDGLQIDAPVITVVEHQEGLVGRVIELGPHVGKVMLVEDSLSAVAAHVDGAESEDGVVEGTNSPDLTFQYVSRDSALKIGDRVVTSGLGNVFPPGLLIGWIQEVSIGARQLFLQARLRPAISRTPVRVVLVLIHKTT